MTDRTCSVEGCKNPYYGRGWCQMHWGRWRRTGNPLSGVKAPIVVLELDLPAECWLPVVGWESLYEVSDMGRVRSLPRKTVSGWRGGKVLKPQLDGKGYFFVHLVGSGASAQCRVHSLVAEAFIGPRPPKLDVCHGRRGQLCNEVTNLRYGTRSENIWDSVKAGTHANARKERCPTCGSDYITKTLAYGRSGRYCPNQKNHPPQNPRLDPANIHLPRSAE